jgi:hypothetical protein
LELPINYLIYTQCHRGSDLCSDCRWLHSCYDLMLELSDNIIDEEYGCSGCKHAHRNIV